MYRLDYTSTDAEENALMYALGDKLDIAGLKILASSKFATTFPLSSLRKTESASVFETVCSTTPASDQGLREIVGERMAEYLLANGRLPNSLIINISTHEGFAATVLAAFEKRFATERGIIEGTEWLAECEDCQFKQEIECACGGPMKLFLDE